MAKKAAKSAAKASSKPEPKAKAKAGAGKSPAKAEKSLKAKKSVEETDEAEELEEEAVEVEASEEASEKPAKAAKAPKAPKEPKAKKTKGKAALDVSAGSEHHNKWLELKEKHAKDKATNYAMSATFEAQQPIQHKSLGWGLILSNNNDRLEVLFESGVKILISNYKP